MVPRLLNARGRLSDVWRVGDAFSIRPLPSPFPLDPSPPPRCARPPDVWRRNCWCTDPRSCTSACSLFVSQGPPTSGGLERRDSRSCRNARSLFCIEPLGFKPSRFGIQTLAARESWNSCARMNGSPACVRARARVCVLCVCARGRVCACARP